ncbi:hypothetical protein BGZ73_009122, partial [Actinomortierella ambigua]
LSVDEAEQLRRYTLAMISRAGRRKYECEMAQMTYLLAPLHANGRFSRSSGHKHADGGLLVREDLSWAEVIPLTKDGAAFTVDMTPLTKDEIQGKAEFGADSEPYDFLVTTRGYRNSDFFIKMVLPHVRVDDDLGEIGFEEYAKSHAKQVLKNNSKDTASPSENVDAGAEADADALVAVDGQPEATKDETAATAAAAAAETSKEPSGTERVSVEEYLRLKHAWTSEIEGPVAVLERTKRFRNHLQTVVQTIEKNEASASMLCTLDQCLRLPIAASTQRAFALLPSALVRLDAYLQAYELQVRLGLTEIPVGLMLVALTTPSANMAMQYERLELLGDSFLKFSCTIRLYIVNPANDEGALHASRIEIVSNQALLRHAKTLELYQYVCATPFYRKAWRPVGYRVDSDSWDMFAKRQFEHVLSNKTLADMVEATLGAAFLAGGTELGLKAARALQIPFPEFEDWASFARVYEMPQPIPALIERNRNNIHRAEQTLGYKFRNPMLFLEAMTHASSMQSEVACYQRLEFLGDAVLDFLVVRQYYDMHPDADPGTIVMAKDNSVSNRILGALAIEMGLYRYLDQSSSGLMSTVANAVVIVEEFKANQALRRSEAGDVSMASEDRGRLANLYSKMALTPEEQAEEFSFWLNIAVPKVLGDLVESTIGAVFVDSGFDYEVVCALFQRLIWPFIERHVTFEDVALHPTKALLEMLQAHGCNEFEYTTIDTGKPVTALLMENRMYNNIATHSGATTVVEVTFRMHGQVLAKVQSPHAEQCRKETSAEVLKLFKSQPTLMTRLCTCPKRKKAVKAAAALAAMAKNS